MVLDLLPWRRPRNGRLRYLGILRYVHFLLSLALVLWVWFILGRREIYAQQSMAELYWLVAGNALYYVVGIGLAGVLKDNRAFCKYFCPIPVLQKIGARFALFKKEIDSEKCNDCGACEKSCPMDIKLLDYKNANQRIRSTECIICHTCANVCPKSAIRMSMNKLDVVKEERLRYKTDDQDIP